MEGWAFFFVLIIGAFLFSFTGVIFLLVKTSRQEKSIRELRRLVKASGEAETPPFAAAPAVMPLAGADETFLSAPPEEFFSPGKDPASAASATVPEPSASGFVSQKSSIDSPDKSPAPFDTGEPIAEKSGAPPPFTEEAAFAAGTSPAPSEESRLWKSFRGFVKSGNLWAAGGVILLLAGFGTLIAYLGRRGFFTVEMGISLAAAAGLVMIFLGWRFRQKRPTYFLILQGGGIGTLYLAVFAAHKLTPYLGVPLSLALMGLLVPPAVIMALFQNSQGLAVLGFLGGFAAPLLLREAGGENHLLLFTCYAILNSGLFAIGFFRSWKGLNLLGFLFTFGVSLAWTAAFYKPELFFGAEPFFLLFIFFFTVLGLRGLEDEDYRFRHYGDIILILGTPGAAAVLQWKVFSFVEHGYAIIAVIFAAFYLLLTVLLLKKGRRSARSYAEGYLAFGALLANIAIPLELSPGISGAIWAAEGAFLFFIGLRAVGRNRESKERRGDPRIMAAGIIVHIAAAAAFLKNTFTAEGREIPAPWRSNEFTGLLIIAISAFVMAAMAEKLSSNRDKEKTSRFPLYIVIWGFFWWFSGWYVEFRRIVPESSHAFFIITLISALLSWALAVFFGLKCFIPGMIPASLTAAYTVITGCGGRDGAYFSGDLRLIFSHNFLESPRHLGWLIFFALQLLTILLYPPGKKTGTKQKQSPEPLWLWEGRIFTTVIMSLAVISATGRFKTLEAGLSVSWTSLAGLLPLFIFLVLFPFCRRGNQRETVAFEKNRVTGKLLFPVLPFIVSGILGLWFLVTLFLPGEPSPLPLYIPVLNPLDLLEGLCIVTVLFWQIKAKTGESSRLPGKAALLASGDIMVFLWIISILARSVHYYGNVLWRHVPTSAGFQLCLFGFWAFYGILHIILGNRLKKRVPWIAGALLVAAAIGKLILFDMRDIGAVPRILSFFASGIILLFIGWAAPLPPREEVCSL